MKRFKEWGLRSLSWGCRPFSSPLVRRKRLLQGYRYIIQAQAGGRVGCCKPERCKSCLLAACDHNTGYMLQGLPLAGVQPCPQPASAVKTGCWPISFKVQEGQVLFTLVTDNRYWAELLFTLIQPKLSILIRFVDSCIARFTLRTQTEIRMIPSSGSRYAISPPLAGTHFRDRRRVLEVLVYFGSQHHTTYWYLPNSPSFDQKAREFKPARPTEQRYRKSVLGKRFSLLH